MDLREKLIEICFHEFCMVAGDSPCGCDGCPYGEYGSENNECFEAYKKDKLGKLGKNGVTVQEWIPVTERLPKEKGEYLVAFHPCWWDDVKWDKTCVGVDTFRGKTAWAKNKFQRVTHWMPLPGPPKGD